MNFQPTEQHEFLNKYCIWALKNAEREAQTGFSMVAKIKGTDSLTFMRYMFQFQTTEQVSKCLALVRHGHAPVLGVAPASNDKREFQDYVAYVRNYEDLQHLQPNVVLPGRATQNKINAKRLAKAVRGGVSDYCGDPDRRTGLEWSHSRTYGDWRVVTWFQVKSNNWQVRYHHTFHKNNGPMIGGFMDIFRSVGGGQAVWDLIEPGEELAVGETIVEICAQFMQSVPEIIGC